MNKNVIAISGLKNSGKTTLITRLIPILKAKGLNIGIIKHDGHEFDPDVEETDSYLYRKSGSDSIGIFSKGKYMLIEEKEVDLEYMLKFFENKDLILLEGFKDSNIPKIEVIRSEVSKKPYCKDENVLAYVSDISDMKIDDDLYIFNIDDIKSISEFIYEYIS